MIHEAATDVIASAQAQGIKHPWAESDFTDKIVCMQKERQINASGNLQFYDRSPFCIYALGQYFSQGAHVEFTPSPRLSKEIERCLKSDIYQNKVFFFENLGFIEHTDARKISYEDALIFEQIHLDAYSWFGFRIIMVPKGRTVAQRCKFILEKV